MSGTDWDKSPQEWFDAKARHAATAAELFRQFLEWESISNDIIDFKKIYVDMANDLNAGLVLSEIVYWYLPSRGKTTNKLRVKKEGKQWIACRRYDWWDRTRMSPKQIDRALDILKKHGLIEQKNFMFNNERTVHIRLIEEKFLELWQYLADNPPPNPFSPKVNSTRGNEPNLPDGEDLTQVTERVRPEFPKGEDLVTESTTETLKPSPTSGDADVSPSEKPKTPRKRDLVTDAVTIHFFDTALGTNPETERLAAIIGNWLKGKSTGTRNMKLEKLKTPLEPDDVPCVVAYFKAKNPDASTPHDLRKIAKWTYEWINAGKPTAPSANGHNPLAGYEEFKVTTS